MILEFPKLGRGGGLLSLFVGFIKFDYYFLFIIYQDKNIKVNEMKIKEKEK